MTLLHVDGTMYHVEGQGCTSMPYVYRSCPVHNFVIYGYLGLWFDGQCHIVDFKGIFSKQCMVVFGKQFCQSWI